ncbi:MAG: methyltransferase domain-containing protein [Burkholderiales bacterium]|nr:methyltransferase domain-containing protein [Burkholderiales bacterium]
MQPVSSSSFTSRILVPDAGSNESDAEVADCLRRAVAGDPGPALAVCAGGLADGATAYRVHRLCEASALEGGGRAPWLPFADAAFATVLLYRVTRHDVDIELLLGEAGRVLRPGGRLLVLEHAGDFAFAPLPTSGPAHLLHAWLRQAGFAEIEVAPCGASSLLAAARN